MKDILNTSPEDVDLAKELAALARLVTFARQSAQSLKVAFPTYCLDLALGAVLEEMKDIGMDTTRVMANDSYGIPGGYH
jgi:hypothetical protein